MSKTKETLGKIRDLPADELAAAIDKTRDELFRLKLASYTNQVQDTASIRTKRRELARILTVLGNRVNGREGQATGGEAAAPKAKAEKPAKAVMAAPAKAAAKAPAKAKAAKAPKTTKQKKEG
jgi:large subunit ribosomal protein L29